MRWHASISALFLLLAGCVGRGGYTDFSGEAAAPVAGPRDQSDQSPPRDPDSGYRQDPGGGDPRGAQLPPPDPYPAAGADYQRPAADGYAPPPAGYPDPGYQDPSAGMPGPRGSSEPGAGEQRYDEVGYAGVRGVAGGNANDAAVVAVARGVAPGSVVEVTALETGRTILVLVTGSMGADADHAIDLSPGAARQLGASGTTIPVRVRTVPASPADQAALRAGRPAADRADTPPVLLDALRKHLPGGPPVADYAPPPGQPQPVVVRPAPVRPAPAPVRSAGTGAGYYVQIAALSNAANAQALARSYGGFVRPGGGLYRVQMGPFRTAGEADAARARAAQGGFGDARVFTQN